jgi:hypothetical protein
MLALPGTSTRSDLAMRAAARLLNGVVSHESAARIHGFEAIPISPPTLTVSHRSNYAFPGVVVHQSTDLLAEHLQEIEGLMVTIPARTLVDLAKVLGPHRLERVVEHALVTGRVDVDELVDLVTALSRRGKRGTKALRTIVDEKVRGVAGTDTQLERLLFRLFDDAGLPRPSRQFSAPWLKSLNGRVDFAYEAEKIVIEADSRRWHLQFDAFEVDKVRDNAAQLTGWIVLRITWRMIKERPTEVIHLIRSALNVRSRPVHSRDE